MARKTLKYYKIERNIWAREEKGVLQLLYKERIHKGKERFHQQNL